MWRKQVSFLTIRMVLNHITIDKNVLSVSLNKPFFSLSHPYNNNKSNNILNKENLGYVSLHFSYSLYTRKQK